MRPLDAAPLPSGLRVPGRGEGHCQPQGLSSCTSCSAHLGK